MKETEFGLIGLDVMRLNPDLNIAHHRPREA